jgi:hypothetical protein
MLALIEEGRGVLQNQYRAGGCRETRRTRSEMSAQNIVLADTVVGQKPVSGLGRRPVLAGKGDGLPHAGPKLLRQDREAPMQPGVLKIASLDFQIAP